MVPLATVPHPRSPLPYRAHRVWSWSRNLTDIRSEEVSGLCRFRTPVLSTSCFPRVALLDSIGVGFGALQSIVLRG